MTKKKSDEIIPRSPILEYEDYEFGDKAVEEFVMHGTHQVELGGSLEDPYIRSKKICAHLRDFLWGEGELHASVVPRETGSGPALPEDWWKHHDFKPVVSPSGKILKLVLLQRKD